MSSNGVQEDTKAFRVIQVMQNKRALLFVTLGFMLVPLLFYSFTVCRTIGFSDTALLINDMLRFGISSHVNNHPMTVLTGFLFIKLLPLQEIAHCANGVSVFYGTLTISVFYWLLRFECGSLFTANPFRPPRRLMF